MKLNGLMLACFLYRYDVIHRVKTRLKQFWAEVALLSVEMLIVIGAFLLALIFFVYLVRRVFVLGNAQFDTVFYNYLGQYVTPVNNNIMQFFSALGKPGFLIIANVLLIIYFLFVKKHKWYSIKIAAISLSSLLVMFLLKNVFERSRPLKPLIEAANGLSFPSGHALMSVTFYGLLGYITWKTGRNTFVKGVVFLVFFFLILFIGLSRIYLHVHYASDVLAGYCIGVLWLVISVTILGRLEKYSRQKIDPTVNPNAN
jgi:membrane-associated phospholipid phosphatase